MKKGWKVIGRKMPPMTQEHRNKLRESNVKTWSNLDLRKKHSAISKARMEKMSPESKKAWKEKVNIYVKSSKHREQSRAVMLRLRENENWLKKSKEKQKEIDINGKNNPFYGKKHSIGTRLKMSIIRINNPNTPRGAKNPAYIDGQGNARKGERMIFQQTLAYRLFREKCFKRDGHKCVLCESTTKICVDHIKEYINYPELRTVIENGRTLCLKCHIKTPNYGRKKQRALQVAA